MSLSIYDAILAQVVSAIQGLAPTDPGSGLVPVVQRKLVTAREGLEKLPLLVVCPAAEPETVRPLAFGTGTSPSGGIWNVVYPVYVALLRAANEDQARADLVFYWRQKVRLLAKQVLPGVPSLWRVQVKMGLPLDVQKALACLDDSGLTLLFSSIE